MNNRVKCLRNLSILDNEELAIDLDPEDYDFDSLEEMKQVIINAFNGQLEDGLDRMQDVRDYINDLIGDREEDDIDDIFEYIIRQYDFEDHPETLRDAKEEYDQTMSALKSISKCLEVDEFKSMNEFIPPSEYVSVKNIVKEKSLPEDMEREIIGFMGKRKITGGKKRKTRKTRMNKKSKKQRKTRKTKTLRRTNRKHNRINIRRI